MEIKDSLSQSLKRVPNGKVNIYLCGPTVYDDVHIGNIAPVVIFDFLIRYLKEKKINYFYVHNITDIDDKIVNKSKNLGISEDVVSALYEGKYLDVLRCLKIIKPCVMPRVSDHIREIQDVITRLIDKGYAEICNEDVVFKVDLVSQYGELSKQKISELKSFSNFCLWKRMKTGKVWYSPWGFGRPGWHTECFAFIDKYCNGKVNIHGGGIDLKFPHHENENAHCRALNNSGLANIWMHIGHLTTQEGKISKSKNNRYLVDDVLKEYSADVIRLLFLTNHYSSPSLVTDSKLQELKKEWQSFLISINRAISHIYMLKKSTELYIPKSIDSNILKFLENDLDLPSILTWLQALKKDLLKAIKEQNIEKIGFLGGKLKLNLEWLGFTVSNIHTEDKLKLLEKWKELVDKQDWDNADVVRKQLINEGLI